MPHKTILLVQSPNHPSQQHKICVITQMSPSYCKTIKTLISSILLAQLVLMHGRYRFPTLFYSKYSILHSIAKTRFFCQQHNFEHTKRQRIITKFPSPQMQLQGSERKILHGKNTLYTSDMGKKRIEITVKAFLSAKKLFFMTLYPLLMLYFSTFF